MRSFLTGHTWQLHYLYIVPSHMVKILQSSGDLDEGWISTAVSQSNILQSFSMFQQYLSYYSRKFAKQSVNSIPVSIHFHDANYARETI